MTASAETYPGYEAVRSPVDESTGPLAGIRVVVLAGMGPVPVAAMLLADMGARVVRIARSAHRSARALGSTDGLAAAHDLVNRGIETVTVDLESADGVATVRRLVADADIFVEGYPPGVAEWLELGPDNLLDVNPAIVYARLTGYGQTGSLAQSAGHDINYVAPAGALHAMGRPGESPRPPIKLLGDCAGGAAIGAFGIVRALVESRGSGRRQVVDAAMADEVALLTTKIWGLRAAGTFSDEPGTNRIDSEIVPPPDLNKTTWDRVIDVNLTGTFLVSKAFARLAVARGAEGDDSQRRVQRWSRRGEESGSLRGVKARRGRPHEATGTRPRPMRDMSECGGPECGAHSVDRELLRRPLRGSAHNREVPAWAGCALQRTLKGDRVSQL